MHTKAYEESSELPPRVVGCPNLDEKLPNRAYNSRRSALSCLLVASSSALVVLSSSSVEHKRSFVVCNSAWVVCSSDWVECNWAWSWVTTGDLYDDAPAVEPLALEGLSNMDDPSLSNPYILPLLLYPPHAFKNRWSSAYEPTCTSHPTFSCSYFSCIIDNIKQDTITHKLFIVSAIANHTTPCIGSLLT